MTVSPTVYVTPTVSGACGITITPPREVRLLLNVAFVESITQCASATPLPVKEWADTVVATLPPISMKAGRPVGAA